jgi:hypothetical protein
MTAMRAAASAHPATPAAMPHATALMRLMLCAHHAARILTQRLIQLPVAIEIRCARRLGAERAAGHQCRGCGQREPKSEVHFETSCGDPGIRPVNGQRMT